MRIWSISDIGLVRHENQDACGTMLIEDYTAAVVCDGMGGTAGGAVASRLAVQTYRQQLEKNLRRHMTAQQLREVSGYAIAAANRAIRQKALEEPSVHSMGTTLVAAIISGEDVLISNVGDSRAYLLGSGGIQQISKDHSLVGSMVEQGNMTEQEARRHPNRNLITRALGPEENVLDDEFSCKWKQGDYLLLCTDGLVNTVSDQELLFEIVHTEDPEHCLRRLVDISVSRGAPDNITAILMQNI